MVGWHHRLDGHGFGWTLGVGDGQEWANLIQMTIIPTAVGKNPLEEMEYHLQSTKESEMQYLGAFSKTTE